MERLESGGERASDGIRSVDLPPTTTSIKGLPFDPLEPWERLKRRTNDFTNNARAFPDEIRDGEFKSEWLLQHALWNWRSAMTRQIGEFAEMPLKGNESFARRVAELKELVMAGRISQMEYKIRRYQLTGVEPCDGTEFDLFLSALTELGGDKIPLEMSSSGRFIPSPPWLEGYNKQQVVALWQAVFIKVLTLKSRFGNYNPSDFSSGEKLVLSPAICFASMSFLGNSGSKVVDVAKEGTPAQVIKYCKRKLSKGATWEGGVRELVGFAYRGTVLAAWVSRLVQGLEVALKQLKWARKFITLADKEWKVSENEDYGKYGSAFRKSFQVQIIWMELHTSQNMRPLDALIDTETAVYEFNLALSIIGIAKEMSDPVGNSFQNWLFRIAFIRKPLASACSYLAATLNSMIHNEDLFAAVDKRTGLFDPGREEKSPLMSLIEETAGRDSYSLSSLVAETYRLAAMNQLPDDGETTILWWGVAKHIADSGGYTIADLRVASSNAIAASEKRDEGLFGPSLYKNSTYQKTAVLLARYYQDKPDDFILPPLEYEKRPDGNRSVFVDGQMLCHDIGRHERAEMKKLKDVRGKAVDEYLDTREADE